MENLNFKIVAQFIAELLSKSFEKVKKYRNFCPALQDFYWTNWLQILIKIESVFDVKMCDCGIIERPAPIFSSTKKVINFFFSP